MTESTASILLKYNKQVPRYTSYPTAPHFSAGVTPDVVAGWISALPADQPASLYFHIPFCRQMCWYCGCHTKATAKYEPVASYVDTLIREIELVGGWTGKRQSVAHIHFGGGSPTMLTPADFSRITDAVRDNFDILPDAEFAIEVDPREVTEAKVAAYARAGVNRASLGVQDFHAKVQTAVNRRQPFHTVYNTVSLMRQYGITDISMDLLYGLPHQTAEMVAQNAQFALALEPKRIALFGYAHVPWMKKHMRLIDESALPDGPARLDQFDAAAEVLLSRGYRAIGLDHFVLENDPMAIALDAGRLHRNFQGYTTDTSEALIGFGVSAISSLPQGYAQNTPDMRSYIRAIEDGTLSTCRGKALSKDDRLRRAVIEQLMCYFALDLGAFCREHGVPTNTFDAELEKLKPYAADGLVRLKGRTIQIGGDARQAVRLVCAAFDAYLDVQEKRHAQVA